MTALSTEILNWFFNPFKCISAQKRWSPTGFWIVAFLCALSGISDWGISHRGDLLFSLFFYMSIVFIFCFFQAITTDFFAQALGKPAQSFRLFTWLVMTHAPLILNMPLNLLSEILPTFSGFFQMGNLACFGYFLYLQLRVFMQLYNTQYGLSILLLLSPVLVMFSGGLTLLFLGLLGGAS